MPSEAFVEAQKAEPGFAMAYWGEAMTYNHPLWPQTAPDLARAALSRLGADSRRAAGQGRERQGEATGCAPSKRSTPMAKSRPATPPTPRRCGACTTSIRTISRSRRSTPWRRSAPAPADAMSPPTCARPRMVEDVVSQEPPAPRRGALSDSRLRRPRSTPRSACATRRLTRRSRRPRRMPCTCRRTSTSPSGCGTRPAR